MKKKGFIMTTIIFLVSLVTFFVLVDRLGMDNIIEVFYRVELWHIGAIIGIMAFYFLFFVLRWQRILKLEGFNIPLKDLTIYRLAGYAVSYLTPAADFGGEPVMAHLLSKDHKKISFTKSLASVVANRIVGLFVNLAFIVISFTYIFFFFVLPKDTTFIFYIILGVVVLLLLTLYIIVLKKRDPLKRIFEATGLYKLDTIKDNKKTIKEFDSLLNEFFHHNPKELFINFVLSILTTVSLICVFWALSIFLGLNMNFLESMVASSIHSTVAALIPVPASIGFGEAGETAWFGIMGIGAASGFSYYIIFRSRDIFYSLAGLVCLFYKGMGEETWNLTKKAFSEGISKLNGFNNNNK